MENNYCVYCHTNKLTGEKYIGASKNIKKRWCANGINYIKYGKFGEAIRKYGWDNFDHKIIKSNLSKAEAEDYEKMYIAELNTIKEGYNIQSGGNLFDGMNGEKIHSMMIIDLKVLLIRFTANITRINPENKCLKIIGIVQALITRFITIIVLQVLIV